MSATYEYFEVQSNLYGHWNAIWSKARHATLEEAREELRREQSHSTNPLTSRHPVAYRILRITAQEVE